MAVIAEPKQDVSTWSPARLYLVISGVFLVSIAVIGVALDRSFPTSPDAVGASRWVLGIFETNGWHTTAAFLSAAAAFAFALRPGWARFGAMTKGIFYVAVTTSLLLVEPSTFLLVSNAADQVVHASLAIGGIATALMTRRA